jgi:hypothetical protein
MDERMHSTPWFHVTNIPNAPPGREARPRAKDYHHHY